MGCCFSKKRRRHPTGADVFAGRCKIEDRDPPAPPPPEEEKVKEVLSETPSAKVRAEEKSVANVVALEEPEVEKAKGAIADATVSDLGSCMSLATDDRSEAASEASVATSSVAGSERSPGKAARKRPVSVSGELGMVRRDRAVAAYGVRSRSARASPSPPPRREQRDRTVRRSPSPAEKRSSEQRRAASPVTSLQRKPPVPVRPSPRRVQEAPPPLASLLPHPQTNEDAMTAGDELSVAEAASTGGDGQGDAEGKESLDNPLVSLECFIFL
ncbi:hypothetical protein ABZP36_025219 [Zizania latifolia]